ncbi:MAG: FAD-dependent oxidoreductase [Candidatus Omnitrophota bacterium]
MNKIVVAGGGFAGVSALNILARRRGSGKLELALVDTKLQAEFLPLLPDIIGRAFAPDSLSYNLTQFCNWRGVTFIREEVQAVDLKKKEVTTAASRIPYDYLIIASGSQTNFYGQSQIAQVAFTLDSVDDARKLITALEQDNYDNFIISGAGYTGVEIATALWRYFRRRKRANKKIMLVEIAAELLGPLPAWMKQYVAANLRALGISVFLESKIEKIEQDRVTLSNGEGFTRAMLIWAAGVKTADFVGNLPLEKNRQGRLKVNEYLQVDPFCFVAGDAAEVNWQGKPLRMAVQFSLAQAQIAAGNVLRSIRGLPLKKYRALDLGYIIPLANNRSCGVVLGVNLKGVIPTALHFMMCIYRSFSWKNKLGILHNIITAI